MRFSDLDQYWPRANGPSPSGTMDETRTEFETQQIAVDPSFNMGGAHKTQANIEPSGRKSPYIWGGLGFLSGMFVWHMIGFWTFVSHVAFNDDPASTAKAAGPAQTPVKALARNVPQNCIALAIDRKSGAAAAEACPANDMPYADAGRTGREDLALRAASRDPQIWVGVTTLESEVATETIDETAFDLTIRPGP